MHTFHFKPERFDCYPRSQSQWVNVRVCVCVCLRLSFPLHSGMWPGPSLSLSLESTFGFQIQSLWSFSLCLLYPEENRRFPSQLGWRRAWKCWPVSILTPYMVLQRLGMKEAAAARSKAATAPPTDPTSACFIKICLLLQTYSHASRRNTSQCFLPPSCFLIHWRRAPLIYLVLHICRIVAAYIYALFFVRIS